MPIRLCQEMRVEGPDRRESGRDESVLLQRCTTAIEGPGKGGAPAAGPIIPRISRRRRHGKAASSPAPSVGAGVKGGPRRSRVACPYCKASSTVGCPEARPRGVRRSVRRNLILLPTATIKPRPASISTKGSRIRRADSPRGGISFRAGGRDPRQGIEHADAGEEKYAPSAAAKIDPSA